MQWNWGILGSTFALSLLSGTEIALITAGSSTERGWGKAWLATGAGLLTMVPIAAILYFVVAHLRDDLVEYVGGGLVFLLGLYFTIKGFLKRDMEQFGAFFTDTTGHRPTSFNAVAVGIMVGYLNGHTSFQKWLKAQGRAFARTETMVSS
jgi:hypothetical protein